MNALLSFLSPGMLLVMIVAVPVAVFGLLVAVDRVIEDWNERRRG